MMLFVDDNLHTVWGKLIEITHASRLKNTNGKKAVMQRILNYLHLLMLA